MSKNVTLWGANYSNVPAINVPQTGGGTARFTDTSPTTATASDVASGKIFFNSNGVQTTGTGEGGGGVSDAHVGYSDNSTGSESSILFNTNGRPTSCIVYAKGDITPLSGVSQISAIVWDGGEYSGSNHVQTITDTANAQVTYVNAGAYPNVQSDSISFFSSENGREFADITYGCIYSYGTTAIVDTKTQSVGSGATSITFTGLTKRPIYFACIFTSNFSTSSGYQRVIAVGGNDGDCSGLEMDSSAHFSTSHWSYTSSNSSLTITSQGTNAGGYFHQPGDYLLVYAYDSSDTEEYQTKSVTYTPTTQTQTQSVTADSEYDALEAVNVTVNPIPSQYIIPTGNLPITQNGNNINVSQYATVSVNVGGGSSLNTQVAQSTTRSTSTSYTEVIALTCAVAGTYDVYWSTFRSSTSGTWGSQLYINDEAYGTAQTGSWSNHIQNIHLTSVSLSKNDDVAVRVRSRGSNYYGYVGTLTIKQTS